MSNYVPLHCGVPMHPIPPFNQERYRCAECGAVWIRNECDHNKPKEIYHA